MSRHAVHTKADVAARDTAPAHGASTDRSRRPQALRVVAATLVALLGASTMVACADRGGGPTAPARVASSDAVHFWESGASVAWNARARTHFGALAVTPSPQVAVRIFAYLSLAQYDALIAAEDAASGATHPSPQGAVAGASAVVLSYFFPAGAPAFEAAVGADEAAAPSWPGERHTDFAAGEAIGRAVGAAVVASARTDRFDAVWTGTVPVGPGLWTGTNPLLPLLGQMRPFFMTSGDEFRPPPPPAFGSPEFLAALAEVRHFSDTRTPTQLAIAQFWATPTGPLAAGAPFWDAEASDLVVRYHLDERRAAHALALANMAMMDAYIACHDAKYTYWLIRPFQADPAITTPVGRPNHPSYPSNHACISGAIAYVLGALFPPEAERLAAMADQAGESRLYAGIHYRFDKDAGLRIARQVADLAVASDVHGHQPFALR